jgi:hypothetical protein
MRQPGQIRSKIAAMPCPPPIHMVVSAPATGPAQLIQGLDGRDGAGGADRVPRDTPLPLGWSARGQAEFTDDGEGLGGEGPVHLEQVDLVELETGPVSTLGPRARDPYP